MRHLSVDIETYSSVDIGSGGLYKYVQSPDFEILLFAYAIDERPVSVIDLKQGETIPIEVMLAMFDPKVKKHAYNAAFEHYCLAKYFYPDSMVTGKWLTQWECTMLHSLYCGYASCLAATGTVMGLDEDKRKMTAGRALIKYFCVPCKPTKKNGGRTRNLPKHDPEKWQSFKEYCKQDVVTEMEIENRLKNFPVPADVQRQWQQDQVINMRGVKVDLALVNGALLCGETETKQLMDEAVDITGLSNPNSVAQLTTWLKEETGAGVPDLKKETVKTLLDGELKSEKVRRILEIRQELGKTSNKKYTAIKNCVCKDGRVRGLLQFYGANRTGRWAGRLVQVQNLPRTYISMLDLARGQVKQCKSQNIKMIFGSVQDTLSQLIRTAFVADNGKVFIDADFSAIEARVIAWLSGEQWRQEVFKTHGKIYEASASQMFGVPIERIRKGNPEYVLRQKGKVAELALGYGGGSGALIKMGALDNGLSEAELPDIVKRWRNSNKQITGLWKKVENAAIEAYKTGFPVGLNSLMFRHECELLYGQDFITVELPSKRKLYYAKPYLSTNRFGNECLCYYGMNQTTRKWQETETYGGKLSENIVQAIARDCLAVSINKLINAGYNIVFHVHDEVVIEADETNGNLDDVCGLMGEPIDWAPGLILSADGYTSKYFKKD